MTAAPDPAGGRDYAVAAARARFASGAFEAALASLVARRTDGSDPAALRDYLEAEIAPRFAALGAETEILTPPGDAPPLLRAERIEDPALPTVLLYGHGDTVPAMEGRWAKGRDPLRLTRDGDRLYGRGVVDNKGQHLIGLEALAVVHAARGGRLGFNFRAAIEMGEERGSPGLGALFAADPARFAADVLIASDGPRVRADRPTLFLGARGAANLALHCRLREGGHHSGNWGGLLRDPGIRLAHALAAITGPKGEIRVPEWRPDSLTPAVRAALADCPVDESGPAVDPDWGEPGLTPAERVWGWNAVTVRAAVAGDPADPVNAVPPSASAWIQLRFVVGTDEADIVPALRRHLDREGFEDVEIEGDLRPMFRATRLDPDSPWALWARESLTRTLGAPPAVLPNLGGSLPNDVFAETLGLPTVWVPHSHPACSQHAPDEHALASTLEEGLAIMAGLWWDLGEPGGPPARRDAGAAAPA